MARKQPETIKMFQSRSQGSSTEQPPGDILLSLSSQHLCIMRCSEQLLTSQLVGNHECPNQAQSEIQVPRSLVDIPIDQSPILQQPPVSQWSKLCRLPPQKSRKVLARAVKRYRKIRAEEAAGDPEVIPPPTKLQLHLLTVPDLGSPELETFDRPMDLVRAYRAKVMEAVDLMSLDGTSFYAFIGDRCKLFMDRDTADVAVHISERCFRQQPHSMEHLELLEDGTIYANGTGSDADDSQGGVIDHFSDFDL